MIDKFLSTIYECSILSCCSELCSVFILCLLMDMPAFCVFKQFSAQVGLFMLCACSSISIPTRVGRLARPAVTSANCYHKKY